MRYKSLLEEIKDWVAELGYWEQYLANRILYGQAITDAEIKNAYRYFLEDAGLKKKEGDRPEIKIPNVKKANTDVKDFQLKEIGGIAGVNALKEGQSIPISKNLTIVYGDNGAGKSGYIRILNNAFVSRGDTHIEPNIYLGGKSKTPSCIFKFASEQSEYELKYPDSSDGYEFTSFAVFDSASVIAHLSSEDEIQFLPGGISFFNSLSIVVEKVQGLLESDILKHTPGNTFDLYFSKPTIIKVLIANLDANSDLEALRAKAKLSTDESKKLASLEGKLLDLKKTDVKKKAKKLTEIKDLIKELGLEFEMINESFSIKNVNGCKTLVEKQIFNKELSAKEGIARFDSKSLRNVGSKEWKNLVGVAKEFAESQHGDSSHYPSKHDVCLLCQQPLSIEAKNLFEAYWKYLASSAENELKEINKEIQKIENTLSELELRLLEKNSVLHEWLAENFKTELDKWREQIGNMDKLRKQIINSLKLKKWAVTIVPKKVELRPIKIIYGFLDEKIAELREVEINRKIRDLEKEVNELTDRKKLGPLLPGIEDLVSKLKWASKARRKVISTRHITSKQSELFAIFVTEEYAKVFNSECEKLNANFGIEISQRGKKGSTLKQLVLKGRSPISILSEGEQRAISMADFLTEIQIGEKNKGIIFDDPVNSLDHTRRQIIAERFVEESKHRQVIVFTHDITFMLALQRLSDEQNVECMVSTLRRIGNVPGIIVTSLPWPACNVNERIKRLNEMVQETKKIEKSSNPDDYYFEAKKWCGLLRETWERGIEELLFNDSIQRFSPGIQTKRLEKAKFSISYYKEIEKGMAECSDWVHDQSSAINAPAPNTAKLELFLNNFKEFARRVRA